MVTASLNPEPAIVIGSLSSVGMSTSLCALGSRLNNALGRFHGDGCARARYRQCEIHRERNS